MAKRLWKVVKFVKVDGSVETYTDYEQIAEHYCEHTTQSWIAGRSVPQGRFGIVDVIVDNKGVNFRKASKCINRVEVDFHDGTSAVFTSKDKFTERTGICRRAMERTRVPHIAPPHPTVARARVVYWDGKERVRNYKKPAPEGMRWCPKCKQNHPIDLFYKRTTRGRHEYQPYCKPCTIKLTAEWNKANPEKLAAYVRKSEKKRRAAHAAQGLTVDGKPRQKPYKSRKRHSATRA